MLNPNPIDKVIYDKMKSDDNKVIPIPKIKQRINSLESNGTFVYRIQFPILVAYAATVHRVQGATFVP